MHAEGEVHADRNALSIWHAGGRGREALEGGGLGGRREDQRVRVRLGMARCWRGRAARIKLAGRGKLRCTGWTAPSAPGLLS